MWVVERGFVCVWEGGGCGLSWWWCWCCSIGIIFRGSSVDLDRLESFAWKLSKGVNLGAYVTLVLDMLDMVLVC